MKNKKKSNKKDKNIIIIISSIILVFIISISIFYRDDVTPHNNPVDTKISTYSNQNITQNAIATNPRFKNIALADTPQTKPIFTRQLASLMGAFKSFTFNLFNIKTPTEREYGSWIWTPIFQMTPEYIESTLEGTKGRGVDVMYVSIDSYLDIFVMPEGAEKERQKERFSKILVDFIKIANEKDIAVDAEAGWQNWAEEGNEYKAFAILNFVKEFNASHNEKFRGFQYDVEPYLLDTYQSDPALVLKNFVNLIDKSEYFLSEIDLRFSVVIPDFYDKEDKVTPKFSYNNKNRYVIEHLIDILDKRDGNSIIIMSYRNFAEGEDGAIEVSENEMKTAKKKARKTKIIIAQETGDFPPPYITFYGTSRNELEEEINKIKSAFDSNPNFGGLAIHYVNTFLELE